MSLYAQAHPSLMPPTPMGFDIFCRVIDNYGDVGVCWRLAKQLAGHARVDAVRLWVDDLSSFARIEPQINARLAAQSEQTVQIMKWDDDTPTATPHEVVIEAFGCTIPDAVLQQMTAQDNLWINLEYLSAEDWVEGCHALPSMQPSGVNKYFFFPGFTESTGGLLREPDLSARRAAWLRSPKPRHKLLRELGMPDALRERLVGGWRQAFLFCYPHAPAAGLVQALAETDTPTVLITPQGILPRASCLHTSNVHVFETPFVDQERFDQLLWSSDLNLVRGEDSLIRAIWAGKPFLWHIYPQDDDAHHTKLDAWLSMARLPAHLTSLMQAWNQGDETQVRQGMKQALAPEAWSTWRHDTTQLQKRLAMQSSLVERLIAFSAQKLDKG